MLDKVMKKRSVLKNWISEKIGESDNMNYQPDSNDEDDKVNRFDINFSSD